MANHINREMIHQARQTNLAEYLLRQGEELQRDGSRYKHAKHDSLVIKDNAYYWNSRSDSGNAVDFLIRHRSLTFRDAVEALTSENQSWATEERCVYPSDFTIRHFKMAKDMSKTFDFLTYRGIDRSIVQRLIDKRLLFQEETHNNMVFVMRDDTGAVVGAELCGTVIDKRFKGVAKGSRYGYGFNVKPTSGEVRYLLFFESAIDLISFWQIKRAEDKSLKNCSLVSMAGMKLNIVKRMSEVVKATTPPRLFLCVDNDDSASEFISLIQGQINDVDAFLPAKDFKDWNDQLRGIKKTCAV